MYAMDYYLRLSVFAVLIHLTIGHIIIYRYNQTIEEFYDLPAQFGPTIPSNGLRVYAVESIPKDACKNVTPRPTDKIETITKYVLIIARTNCTFEEKISNAQKAGYDAAIVYNIGSDDLEQMSAKDGSEIKIPSVFVGETTGTYIIEGYDYKSGFALLINDELPFNINTHLIIPFSILVGLCFIIMIVYMIYRCAREQRRLRQHRLPKRLLKKIPTVKFTKGLPYESCAICLDDYAEGDKLRVLPCQHAYHCNCIDPWLTKNRRVCPICKRKVFPKGESSRRSRRRPASSDSMSDSETDDTTPLLNPVENNSNNTNHGTFNNTSSANVLSTNNDELQSRGRTNPFDRLTNNSSNTEQDMQNVSRSIFNIFSVFSRVFRRNRSSPSLFSQNTNNNTTENPANTILESTIRSVSVNLPPRPSSNNVLNTNLSGSFKEGNNNNNNNNDDDEDDDDERIERRTIYEPINPPPSNVDNGAKNNRRLESSNDSVFIQTPSRGGIGVAALPNTSFDSNSNNNNSSNNSNRRGRRNGNKGNSSLFIV